MYFYEIAILNSPLEPLTYCVEMPLDKGTEVQLLLRNRLLSGVVLKTCDEPAFKTSLLESVTDNHFSTLQIKMAKFIAEYYFCSLGEALNLFVPFNMDKDASPVLESEGEKIESKKSREKESSIQLTGVQDEALLFLQKYPVSLLFGDSVVALGIELSATRLSAGYGPLEVLERL